MTASQREWRLEKTASGWQLDFRHHLSPFRYVPSQLPAWTRWLIWPLVLLAFIGPLVWLRHQPLAPRFVQSMVLPLWLLILWLVPTRLRPFIGASYVEAVRRYRVLLHEGKFDVTAGQFEEESLLTLRLQRLPFTDRMALVFDGHVEKCVELVGWPGLPVSEADSLREALLAMVRLRVVSDGL